MKAFPEDTYGNRAIAAAFLLAGPVLADDVRPPEKRLPPAKALAGPGCEEDGENVTKMQAQLARIGAAKTDEDRRKQWPIICRPAGKT